MNKKNCVRHGELVVLDIGSLNAGGEGTFLLGSEVTYSASEDRNRVQLSVVHTKGHDFASKFFMNCIFEVGAGDGYNSPGEQVHYGSPFPLILYRSGEYLHAPSMAADDEAKLPPLDFVDSAEYQKKPKDCMFKMKPRFKARSEGEGMAYNDVVIFQDSTNRTIKVTDNRDIIISWDATDTATETTVAVRLIPFLKFAAEHRSSALRSGDLITLFHKEEDFHLVVTTTSAENSTDNLLADEFLDSSAAPVAIRRTLPLFSRESASRVCAACSYWQIETFVKYSMDNSQAIGSYVSTDTRIRLRNVLTNLYLTVSSDIGDEVAVTNVADESTVFELHSDSTTRGNDEAEILNMGDKVRLYHEMTGQYIVLRFASDSRGSLKFACDSTNYDSDVYLISAPPDDRVDSLVAAKGYRHALLLILYKLRLVTTSISDTLAEIHTAARMICNLLSNDTGILTLKLADVDSESGEVSELLFMQTMFAELGFVQIALELSSVAFRNAILSGSDLIPPSIPNSPTANNLATEDAPETNDAESPSAKLSAIHRRGAERGRLNVSENELARSAYYLIKRMVEDNPAVAKVVAECAGIPQMIQHLELCDLREAPTSIEFWVPPLMDVVDALAILDSKESFQLIRKADIKALVDQVYSIIALGHLPTGHQYRVLARMCSADVYIPPNMASDNNSKKSLGGSATSHHTREMLQLWVCEQILGLPPAHEDMPSEHGSGGDHSSISFSGRVDVSTFAPTASAMIFRTRLAENREVDALKKEGVDFRTNPVYICTVPSGQMRPPYYPDITQEMNSRPAEFEPWGYDSTICDVSTHLQVMDAFHRQMTNGYGGRESISNPFDLSVFETQTAPSSTIHAKNGICRLLFQTFQDGLTGKRLDDLSEEESEFYVSSLVLLAEMCSGRNVATQRIVRTLVPVDHILAALDVLQEATQRMQGKYPSGISAHRGAGGGGSSLLTLRESFLHLLRTCYIDCGVLAPLPPSALNAFLRLESTRKEMFPTWNDLFFDECYGKVFCIASQDNEFDVRTTEDETGSTMTDAEVIEELSRALDFLKSKAATAYAETSPFTEPSSKLISELAKYKKIQRSSNNNTGSNPSSLPSMPDNPMRGRRKELPPLPVSPVRRGSGGDVKTAIDNSPVQTRGAASSSLEDLVLLAREFLSLHRRERKRNFAMRNFKALTQRAQLGNIVMSFIRHECNDVWRERVEKQLIPFLKDEHPNDYFAWATLRFSGKQGSQRVGDEETFARAYRANKYMQMTLLQRIGYTRNMLSVIHSLLLRKFFDPLYNENPLYYSRSNPFNNHRHKRDGLNHLDFEAEGSVDDDHYAHHDRKNHHSGVLDDDEEPDALYFYGDVAAEMSERLLTGAACYAHQLLSPTGRTHTVIRTHSVQSRLQQQSQQPHQQEGDRRSGEVVDAAALQDIINVTLDIIGYNDGMKKSFEGADMVEIDKYFRLQFGYCNDNEVLDAVMEVKHLTCKILKTCIELIQSHTVQTLWFYFVEFFDTHREYFYKRMCGDFAAEEALTTKTKKGAVNDKQSFQGKVERAFRAMSEADGQMGILLWRVSRLFTEKSIWDIINLVYFDDSKLRADALGLVFLCNARMSLFSEYLTDRFLRSTRSRDLELEPYINAQIYRLQQLVHSYRFEVNTYYAHLARSENGGSAESGKAGTDEQVGDSSSPCTNRLLFVVRHLLQTLQNTNVEVGYLGLIDFCYTEVRGSQWGREFYAKKSNTANDASRAANDDSVAGYSTTSFLRKFSVFDNSAKKSQKPQDKYKYKKLRESKEEEETEETEDQKKNKRGEDEAASQNNREGKASAARPLISANQDELLLAGIHNVVLDLIRNFIVTLPPSASAVTIEAADAKEEYRINAAKKIAQFLRLRVMKRKAAAAAAAAALGLGTSSKDTPFSAALASRTEVPVTYLPEQLELFRLTFQFLRVFIQKNEKCLKAVSTRENTWLLVKARKLHPEALQLLADIFLADRSVVNWFGKAELRVLFRDLQQLSKVLGEKFKQPNLLAMLSGKFSLRSRSSKAAVLPLKISSAVAEVQMSEIVFALEANHKHISQWLNLFNDGGASVPVKRFGAADKGAKSKEKKFSSGWAIEHAQDTRKVTNEPKRKASLNFHDAVVEAMLDRRGTIMTLTQIGIGVPERSDDSRVECICTMYQAATNRSTHSRAPSEVFTDPTVDEKVYQRLMKVSQRWTLLPTEHVLRLHLSLVSLLGTSAIHHPEARTMVGGFFPSNLLLLKLALVDKHEIRGPYVHLLHGILFGGRSEHAANAVKTGINDGAQGAASRDASALTSASSKALSNIRRMELSKPHLQVLLKALLYSFVQDLRFFRWSVHARCSSKVSFRRDDTADHAPSDSMAHQAIAETGDATSSSDIVGSSPHIPLIDKYVRKYALPFLLGFFKSDVAVDDEGRNAEASANPAEPETSFVAPKIFESLTNVFIDVAAALGHHRCATIFGDDAKPLMESMRELLEIIQRRRIDPNKGENSPLVLSNESLKVKVEFAVADIGKSIAAVDNNALQIESHTMAVATTTAGFPRLPAVFEDESVEKDVKKECLHDFLPIVLRLVKTGPGTDTNTPVEDQLDPKKQKEFLALSETIRDIVVDYGSVALREDFMEVKQLFKKPGTKNPNYSGNDKSEFPYFLKWTSNEGMLLQLILSHMETAAEIALRSSSLKANERSPRLDVHHCKSIAYWIDVLTEGVLSDKLSELQEGVRTLEMIDRIEDERNRMRFLQLCCNSLGAHKVFVTLVRLLGIGNAVIDGAGGRGSKAALDAHILVRQNVFSNLLLDKALVLGQSIMRTGNPQSQNEIVNMLRALANSSTGVTKEFMSSLRLMMQYFSFTISQKSQMLTEEVAVEFKELMTVLQLMCEGHNENSQSFLSSQGGLENVNLVGEVAHLVQEVANTLAKTMESCLYDDGFLSNKFLPRISGRARKVINWCGHGKPGHDGLSLGFDVDEMSLLCDILTSGLEALSEFTQGPCHQNQIAVAHSGATTYFSQLFEFLGSFQCATPALATTVEGQESAESTQDKDKNKSKSKKAGITSKDLYFSEIGREADFHRALQIRVALDGSVTYRSKRQPVYWLGDDPVVTEALVTNIRTTSKMIEELRELKALGWTGPSKRRKGCCCWSLCCCCRGDNKKKNKKTKMVDGIVITEEQSGSGEGGADVHVEMGVTAAKAANSTATAPSKNTIVLPTRRQLRRRYAQITPSEVRSPRAPNQLGFLVKSKLSYVADLRRKKKVKGREDDVENIYESIHELGDAFITLEKSLLKFVESILEGSRMEAEPEVAIEVFRHIGQDNLICNMENYWTRFLSNVASGKSVFGSKQAPSFEKELAYSYYALVMRMCDIRVDDGFKLAVDTWIRKSNIPIKDHIARIELHGQEEGKLMVAYFPIPDLIRQYWGRAEIAEMKTRLLFPEDDSKMTTAEEKVKGFLRGGQRMIASIRHFKAVDVMGEKNILALPFVAISRNLGIYMQLSFVATLVMNGLLLRYIQADTGNWDMIADPDGREMMYHAGIGHLAITLCTAFCYTLLEGWLQVQLELRENPECEYVITGRIPSRLIGYLLLFVPYTKVSFPTSSTGKIRVWRAMAGLYALLSNKEVLQLYIICVFSILGNFFHPLFFGGCMVDALRMSKLMQYVTGSFTNNFDQVAVTVALGGLLIYMFVVVSYSSSNVLMGQYDFAGHMNCDSLSNCLRSHFDYGYTTPPSWHDGDSDTFIHEPGAEVFNFLYQFVMNVVIPGIVSGIIIDTFAELRAMKQSIEKEVADVCYICNLAREDIEMGNIAFSDHVQNDHNMWKYLWYIIYLEERNAMDYTGLEQFCFVNLSTTRWLPLKKARALSKVRDRYDLYSVYSKVQSLQSEFQKLDTYIRTNAATQQKNLNTKFSELEKQLKSALAAGMSSNSNGSGGGPGGGLASSRRR